MSASVLRRFRHPLLATVLLGVFFVFSIFLPPVNVFADALDYLPLHAGLEIFAIVVAGMVFALGWNLRRSARGGRLVWLGAACLAAGLLDFAHLMSYPGMPPFFTPNQAEKAIGFWLMARLIGALGLLAHAVLPEREGGGPAAAWAVLGAIVVTLGWSWLVLAHPQVFPATFVEGRGVTPLKSALECGLALLYLGAAVLLARRALADGESVGGWLAAAAVTMALAELHFARYAAVADLYNALGHAYKAAAFTMIYRAVFVSGVRAPQRALAAERALLRGLIDSVPDLIAFRDRDGRYLGCNKAFAEAYGIREDALIGRSDGEVFAGRLPLAEAGQEAVSGAENHEERLEAADGTLRLLDTLRTPYFDADGRQLGGARSRERCLTSLHTHVLHLGSVGHGCLTHGVERLHLLRSKDARVPRIHDPVDIGRRAAVSETEKRPQCALLLRLLRRGGRRGARRRSTTGGVDRGVELSTTTLQRGTRALGHAGAENVRVHLTAVSHAAQLGLGFESLLDIVHDQVPS